MRRNRNYLRLEGIAGMIAGRNIFSLQQCTVGACGALTVHSSRAPCAPAAHFTTPSV